MKFRKAFAQLSMRRKAYDLISENKGYKRPGSMNGRK